MKKMNVKKVGTSISMKDENKNDYLIKSKMHGCLNFLLVELDTASLTLECEKFLPNNHLCLSCIFAIRRDNPQFLASTKRLAYPFLQAVMSNWSIEKFQRLEGIYSCGSSLVQQSSFYNS
jgi:hypothetical protein